MKYKPLGYQSCNRKEANRQLKRLRCSSNRDFNDVQKALDFDGSNIGNHSVVAHYTAAARLEAIEKSFSLETVEDIVDAMDVM
uniref:Uncharacterized protein n=1 Tax=Oryza meridionalis TaxID=40149 RepID=A0A0E0EJU6_9ORYZ